MHGHNCCERKLPNNCIKRLFESKAGCLKHLHQRKSPAMPGFLQKSISRLTLRSLIGLRKNKAV